MLVLLRRHTFRRCGVEAYLLTFKVKTVDNLLWFILITLKDFSTFWFCSLAKYYLGQRLYVCIYSFIH